MTEVPLMVPIYDTDLCHERVPNTKQTFLIQKQNIPQIMQQVSKNKKVDSITEIEHASIDFNVLNYLEETVNAYNTGDESERKSDFFVDISNYDSSRTEIFPVKYICSTTVRKNTQF